MPITLKGIDFLLTYNCTSQCAHCCYRSGPGRGGRLTVAEVEGYLRQISHHPLEWVLLFGGEPFILLDDLAEMIAAVRCHTTGRPLVFTNGYWAYNENVARQKLSRLREAGLDYILFSVDAFHSAFVPVARAALGIRVARELGFATIEIDNQWVLSPDLDIPTNAATRRMMETLAEMVDLSGVEVVASRTHPTGRAAECLPEILRAAGKMPQGLCEAEGLCLAPYYLGEDLRQPYAVEVHPDGEVDLCAGISLGNARRTPLADLLMGYDYTKHSVIHTIVESGPIALLAEAERAGYQRRPGYVDQCHLCYEVRSFLRTIDGMAQYLAPAAVYDRRR
jgi:pyruvate-formate lyase-activating enzyme